ncbi:nucleotidyltransferase family protein [Macrococcus equipercicus]|uniref:Nucleotidyltransferase family protein n=1 Tax=Macrococcus equipercicus TaxID=69967 RepID=A0A9Q9BU16_9STAP|nr:nucleotidyltransferase family protein [Macrococcus equipercicus]UTH14046.1 nucleotidyltransferase family protein [Macrococcus equipercicus]
MIIKSKEELINIIETDKDMIEILKTVSLLNLSDWWISAGFIRNKIWDVLHDYNIKTEYNDVDVIYYDVSDIQESIEKKYEKALNRLNSEIPWSVKNQARMHLRNGTDPYDSSVDAVNQYPECPTAICIKLVNNKVVIHYNYNFEELFNGIVRPTPYFDNEERKAICLKRIEEKDWYSKWPKLEIYK